MACLGAHTSNLPLLLSEQNKNGFQKEIDIRKFYAKFNANVLIIKGLCSTSIPYLKLGKSLVARHQRGDIIHSLLTLENIMNGSEQRVF